MMTMTMIRTTEETSPPRLTAKLKFVPLVFLHPTTPSRSHKVSPCGLLEGVVVWLPRGQPKHPRQPKTVGVHRA